MEKHHKDKTMYCRAETYMLLRSLRAMALTLSTAGHGLAWNGTTHFVSNLQLKAELYGLEYCAQR